MLIDETKLSICNKCYKMALAECRGTMLIEARKLSWYIRALLRADARFAHRSGAKVGVRVQQPLHICLEGRTKSKKCDKQLTHIVRVSTRYY